MGGFDGDRHWAEREYVGESASLFQAERKGDHCIQFG